MYSKIYDFCKVKNLGNCFKNGETPTPRVNFVLDLCDQMGLKYELDTFSDNKSDDLFTIRDFQDIMEALPEDKKKQANILYGEFRTKIQDLTKEFRKSGMGMDPSAIDFQEDKYQELEDEYSEKLREIAGEIQKKRNNYFNIVLPGSSDKFVVAHHDIVNKDSDNANDN